MNNKFNNVPSISRPILLKKTIQKIGSYELNRDLSLGSGPNSMVYLGKCIDIDKINKYKIMNGNVAIKKISTCGLSETESKLLKNEISTMELIKNNPHPNIIKCYEIVSDIDAVYIIMEYCECGDFSKLTKKPMTERVAKYYFKQIVDAVIYMDKNNIIHRDMKPKNILLTNNNTEIKICDFGFAREKNSLKRISTICGSPLYMAPEILCESPSNESVDVWSIGIILYEMLFVVNPYKNCKKIDDLRLYVETVEIVIPPKNLKVSYRLSPECISLLNSMLDKNESTRINIKNIISNKWFDGFNLANYKKYIEIDKDDSDDENNSDNENDCNNDSGIDSDEDF